VKEQCCGKREREREREREKGGMNKMPWGVFG